MPSHEETLKLLQEFAEIDPIQTHVNDRICPYCGQVYEAHLGPIRHGYDCLWRRANVLLGTMETRMAAVMARVRALYVDDKDKEDED